jgi:hypothetical protein
MDKVQKYNSFNINTPWSESYRNYRSKSPRSPLDKRLGGPQSRSGRGSENKIPAPAENWGPNRPAHSLVTTKSSQMCSMYYVNTMDELQRDGEWVGTQTERLTRMYYKVPGSNSDRPIPAILTEDDPSLQPKVRYIP